MGSGFRIFAELKIYPRSVSSNTEHCLSMVWFISIDFRHIYDIHEFYAVQLLGSSKQNCQNVILFD
jgi:hypothetical protein